MSFLDVKARNKLAYPEHWVWTKQEGAYIPSVRSTSLKYVNTFKEDFQLQVACDDLITGTEITDKLLTP